MIVCFHSCVVFASVFLVFRHSHGIFTEVCLVMCMDRKSMAKHDVALKVFLVEQNDGHSTLRTLINLHQQESQDLLKILSSRSQRSKSSGLKSAHVRHLGTLHQELPKHSLRVYPFVLASSPWCILSIAAC